MTTKGIFSDSPLKLLLDDDNHMDADITDAIFKRKAKF